MLAGHFAVGLALKARYHQVPVLAILFSVLLLDWIWLVLVWQDVEHFRLFFTTKSLMQLDLYDVAYSHSLFWALFYAVGTFLVFVRAEGQRHWAAPLSLGIFSHWLLDGISYSNLPFANFGPAFHCGLGLEAAFPILACAIEGVIVLAGWGFYYQTQGSAAARGPLWAILMVLLLLLLAPFLWTKFFI